MQMERLPIGPKRRKASELKHRDLIGGGVAAT
jgi:hypothetical protein